MGNYRIDTRCVQSGYSPANGEPRVPPIVQSTTFRYDSCDQMGAVFDLESEGYFYTRLGNPTAGCVEAKTADLEGGSGAILTASGQSAVLMAVLNLCKAGDHIITSNALYGGTYNTFSRTLPDLGIDVTFVDTGVDDAALDAAFRPNTKLVYGEVLANPSLVLLDIRRFADAAHAHGVPLIVDNTFPTPILCRPFEHGADIIVHSTSKYMDGHARALGGAIVEYGRFDAGQGAFHWKNGRFPGLAEPDESYHGLVYADRFGDGAFIAKARMHLMRDMGASPAPLNAFLLHLGLETLALRMERHCSNAFRIAEWLETHPDVSWVNYPLLSSSPYRKLAGKYLPNGASGVISFGVAGGRQAAVRFMDSLRLGAIVTHVADARTSVIHPASTTQRQMDAEGLKKSGVREDMVRLSVGIENPDDILEDLDQALIAARI
ncbi:MAG: O-acetylhomoserine aminocarboxypropyltransferase/cysteine synthase [Clostridia bacterium]|nr:O-acetylhomoserine aminocarboxypropyltransferase/cysteine synthase [Clostridia bacterium]